MMFVVSVKKSKLRIVSLAVFAIVVCAAFFAVLHSYTSKQVLVDGGVNLKASTAKERVAFLSQYGWEIDEEPVCVKEIMIPDTFDEQYKTYNKLQNTQNMDLSKYCGERVKLWTYNVKNYPGYEDTAGIISANVYIYNGAVIAGDISCSKDNGFVKGFEYPSDQQPASTAQTVTTTTG